MWGVFAAVLASAGTPPLDEDVSIHRFSRGFVGVYALEGADGVVLVDTHYARSTRWLRRRLERAGLAERITLILLTHGHSDHAGGAVALQEALGVPLLAGAGDLQMLHDGDHGKPEPESLLARLIAPTIPRRYPAVSSVDVVISDEPLSLRPYGVSAVALPVGGHSRGSLVVRLESSGLVICGDLIRGSLTAHHRPRLHFFHEDAAGAHDAVRSLLDAGAPALLPAHGDALSAERLEAWLDRHHP